MNVITLRPPMRSVTMPAGRRHSEPLSTATALIHDSWTSVSPSSFWMGTPRIPNISQAANIRVKAMVDSHSTRPAPGGVVVRGAGAAAVVVVCDMSAPFEGL